MTPIEQPAGSVPHFANLYVTFWSVINLLFLIAIVLLVIWYVKRIFDYRKQVLNKLDNITSLLQNNNADTDKEE